MKTLKQRVLLSVIVLLMATLSGPLNAQDQLVSFSDFLTNTASANSSQYVGQPGYKVQDDSTFEHMQQYIQNIMTVREKIRPWPQSIVPEGLTTIGAGNDLNLIW